MANILTNNRVARYFKEAYIEMRKVVWPTPETTRKHALLVLGISLFVALYFGALDYVLTLAVEQLI